MARGRGRNAALVATAAKRYWREVDAQTVVDAWRRSGEPLSAFAAGLRVPGQRIARWASRLEESVSGDIASARSVRNGRDVESLSQPAEVAFHPVHLVGAERVSVITRREPIEVVLGESVRVRVPEGFASEHLSRVLAVLAEQEAC